MQKRDNVVSTNPVSREDEGGCFQDCNKWSKHVNTIYQYFHSNFSGHVYIFGHTEKIWKRWLEVWLKFCVLVTFRLCVLLFFRGFMKLNFVLLHFTKENCLDPLGRRPAKIITKSSPSSLVSVR